MVVYLSLIVGFPLSAVATAVGSGSSVTLGDDLTQLRDPIVYFISTPTLDFVVRRSPPIVPLTKNNLEFSISPIQDERNADINTLC